MSATTDVCGLADRLATLAAERGGRIIAALAGPPGAGKSTVAEAVALRLNMDRAGFCAVLPMDGFHFDDAVLEPRGWRPRKGAPHTFDVGGLRALLGRLRANAEDEIAVPVFDRRLEIARAGARLIPRETPVVLVEGNYLLLRAEPWASLRPFFDLTVAIAADEATLARRLTARWAALPAAEARGKVEQNDLPNARTVLRESIAPDLTIGDDANPAAHG
jgi:pantothenate kinase